jgi:hypothetical protein
MKLEAGTPFDAARDGGGSFTVKYLFHTPGHMGYMATFFCLRFSHIDIATPCIFDRGGKCISFPGACGHSFQPIVSGDLAKPVRVPFCFFSVSFASTPNLLPAGGGRQYACLSRDSSTALLLAVKTLHPLLD